MSQDHHHHHQHIIRLFRSCQTQVIQNTSINGSSFLYQISYDNLTIILRLRARIGDGVDLAEDWLDRLEERDRWLTAAAAAALPSSLFSCRGRTIASNMSPITWKHGSTMKSIKPTHTNTRITGLTCFRSVQVSELPLPLTVSCFSKIQIGLPFRYRLTRVVPDKGPLNGCVCQIIYQRVTTAQTAQPTMHRLL